MFQIMFNSRVNFYFGLGFLILVSWSVWLTPWGEQFIYLRARKGIRSQFVNLDRSVERFLWISP